MHRAYPVIIGPTAGGKSDLAVRLAHAMIARGQPCEILAADAYQIYRRMDIGTAKPTLEERAGIPHLLIDIVDPRDAFTASDWLTLATRTITNCFARNVLPIVVGGTHLYVKLLLDGMFAGPAADEDLREELRALGLPALRAELERIDPTAASRIHPNDERRTIRAIEVFRLTGTPISELQQQWGDTGGPPLRGGSMPTVPDHTDSSPISSPHTQSPTPLLIGLDWPTDLINRRINARVKLMMERGFLAEVRDLHAANAFGPQSREALGYKQLLAHLDGRSTLDDAIEQIKIQTRRFAKNQRTWLKRLRMTPTSHWIDATTDPTTWPSPILTKLTPP
ncbi:MAG TPA: tRNA (adenosine(37)-N6)-dimethylallyltransferase MiaA [Phycisphaerales bacterium]|nr:tRNA (adenosine(37)-N6)-dimethylallyltransferase MiaA [Phycisphaerales bacterium]